MWPLERRRSVLRVGRDSIELWRGTAQGLVLHASRDVECHGAPQAADLERPLKQLLRGETQPVDRWARNVDIVFESAWLPVTAFGVGSSLSTRGRVESLLRHHMGELHEPREPFELRLDYRVGDTQVLGYALAPATKRAVIAQVTATGMQTASVQPAFAWGWSRLSRHRRHKRSGWWLWLEQDRCLVAQWRHGRVVTLNAGAAPASADTDIARAVGIEAVRQGVLKDLDVVHAGWHAATSDLGADARYLRAGVAAPAATSPTCAAVAAGQASAA